MNTPQQPKRRQFFKIASAGTVASASGGIPMLFMPNAALAEEVLGKEVFKTIVKIARDIFPHDSFEDELYANAVGVYADQAKADPALKKMLLDGVKLADITAARKFSKDYIDVPTEAQRVEVLNTLVGTEFFGKLRGDLVVSLYNQPAVWAKLGYQGPSADKGGYINRGFNDQDWMDKI
jgi:hypothetical protein